MNRISVRLAFTGMAMLLLTGCISTLVFEEGIGETIFAVSKIENKDFQ